MKSPVLRYHPVAISLHWLMALCILAQLASGLWMSDAISDPASRKLAYQVYQWHKAMGLCVLVLACLRLAWRVSHPAPPLPHGMKPFEKLAAHATHGLFYVAMITIPLLGWAMVSSSPYGLPTMIFGLFEWPHLPWFADLANKKQLNEWFEEAHELAAYALIGLLALHVAAVAKHQFIAKDHIIRRMMY